MRSAARMSVASLLVMVSLGSIGCDFPGRPREPAAPGDAFATLWGKHCSGCHGADGESGPARNLNDSLYWAIAADEDVRAHIRSGVPGTAMPPFETTEGGPLTEQDVVALVAALRARWSRPQQWASVDLPGYGAEPGTPGRGRAVFTAFCATCHGADGGSVVDPSFLRLVSRQALRLAVICGRRDLGAPDWRSVGERAMTKSEIDDVVAWLMAVRDAAPIRTSTALNSHARD